MQLLGTGATFRNLLQVRQRQSDSCHEVLAAEIPMWCAWELYRDGKILNRAYAHQSSRLAFGNCTFHYLSTLVELHVRTHRDSPPHPPPHFRDLESRSGQLRTCTGFRPVAPVPARVHRDCEQREHVARRSIRGMRVIFFLSHGLPIFADAALSA